MTDASTHEEPSKPAAGDHSRSVVLLIAGLAFCVLAIDQLTKIWALNSLVLGAESRPLIGDFIGLRLIFNSGAAMSLGSSATWVMTLIATVVVVAIIRFSSRIKSKIWAVTLGLVLGGAFGNLIDRLVRAPGFPNGHVVDFIDYGVFIGNVADIAIVIAAGIVIVLSVLGIGIDGDRNRGDLSVAEMDATQTPEKSR